MNTPEQHAGEHVHPRGPAERRRARSRCRRPPAPRPARPRGPRAAGPARAPRRAPVPGPTRRSSGAGSRRTARCSCAPPTASGAVGQMPDATPAEALAFFTRRYADLAFEVELLEQRVAAGTLCPDEAAASVKQVHATLQDAQAVGDLAGLDARLGALNEYDRRAARAAPRGAGPQARGAPGATRSGSPPRPSGSSARQRLAQRRQPDAPAARRVEGAPPAREVGRRRPVAPVLDRPDDVHPAPEGALRRPEREAGRRARRQGEARRRGRGARDLDRLGCDRGPATAT